MHPRVFFDDVGDIELADISQFYYHIYLELEAHFFFIQYTVMC